MYPACVFDFDPVSFDRFSLLVAFLQELLGDTHVLYGTRLLASERSLFFFLFFFILGWEGIQARALDSKDRGGPSLLRKKEAIILSCRAQELSLGRATMK